MIPRFSIKNLSSRLAQKTKFRSVQTNLIARALSLPSFKSPDISEKSKFYFDVYYEVQDFTEDWSEEDFELGIGDREHFMDAFTLPVDRDWET